ncbi:hypothetical protein TIFTF001_029392 [Ficus carica]|uniref:Uncharacterized protein n=1 Tax=Ficus carica TaxID=3494 RepID=A0AA88DRF3_FICCA|nr:hypothetical protein TIFTF001_029392 [Ficus carica]
MVSPPPSRRHRRCRDWQSILSGQRGEEREGGTNSATETKKTARRDGWRFNDCQRRRIRRPKARDSRSTKKEGARRRFGLRLFGDVAMPRFVYEAVNSLIAVLSRRHRRRSRRLVDCGCQRRRLGIFHVFLADRACWLASVVIAIIAVAVAILFSVVGTLDGPCVGHGFYLID